MEEERRVNTEPVPYIVFESAQARSERHIKRITIALIVAVILIFLSNALWLNAWMQYDYVGYDDSNEITVDAGSGTANYIGNDGDITNGENNSEKDN